MNFVFKFQSKIIVLRRVIFTSTRSNIDPMFRVVVNSNGLALLNSRADCSQKVMCWPRKGSFFRAFSLIVLTPESASEMKNEPGRIARLYQKAFHFAIPNNPCLSLLFQILECHCWRMTDIGKACLFVHSVLYLMIRNTHINSPYPHAHCSIQLTWSHVL